MSYRFGKTSLKNIETVWPEGQEILHRAMSFQIIDFGLPRFSGGRTPEDQEYLFSIGRRGIPGEAKVTWTKNSMHLIRDDGYGRAFDVVPYVNNRFSWDEKHCLVAATAIFRAAMELEHKLDWGYHLWGKDMPHFQTVKEN